MMKFPARLLATLPLIALIATPDAAIAKPKRPGVWAQTYTDRPADPDIRFGQLPSGLRYALRRNTTPASQIAMRLYIGSGSLAEPKGSEGLAHFLEHMAFRGSKAVADGEAMRMLARQGLAIGADANAGTTPEATVFSFDFPQGGKPAIDTGLMLFREIATNLLIDPKSVDAERGVVLAEERLRDGPAFHTGKAELAFELQGQIAADRIPIGHIDVIQRAPASLIRAFYETNYRPDNAAIVVVGDIDPVAIEAEIKTRFSDWQAKGTASARPALGEPARRGEEVKIFSEPGVPTRAQVSWMRPFDDRADTPDRERDDYDRVLGLLALNQRLRDISQRVGAPFLNAGVQRSNLLQSADVTAFVISPLPTQPLESIRAAVDEQVRAVRFGISQAELDRAVANINTVMAGAAAGAAGRPSNLVANLIVRDIGNNEVTRSPAQDQADVQEWNRFLSLGRVNNALKKTFAGSGPLVFFSAPQAPEGGEAALRAAFDNAGKGLAAPVASATPSGWPYTSFGTPGTVANRRDVPGTGVTIVTFANGVTLGVKTNKEVAGQVLVNVAFGQGRLGLPADKTQSYWMVLAPSVFIEGGTGKLGSGEMQRVLTGKAVNVGLIAGDNLFALQGRTTPGDYLTELQLMGAYVTDPGFRPEAATRAASGLTVGLPQIESTPSGVFARDMSQILHNGDPRWSQLPTLAQLAQSRPQDMYSLLDPALSSALTVTVVGDISVDKAIEGVAATLGALPQRPAYVPPPNTDIRPPAPNAKPRILEHSGRADQAIAYQAWATDGYFAAADDSRALSVAAAAIKQRLFDQLREGEGATYAPNVSAPASNLLPHYGLFQAQVEIAPEKAQRFYAMLDTIVADLAAKPLSADELDRAKRPLIDARKHDLDTNAFWTGIVSLGLRDPRAFEAAGQLVPGLEKVTAADVQRAAAKYLTPNKSFRVLIKAKGAATP